MDRSESSEKHPDEGRNARHDRHSGAARQQRARTARLGVHDSASDLRGEDGRGRDERLPRGDCRGGVEERRRCGDGADGDAGLAGERVHGERGVLAAFDAGLAAWAGRDEAGFVVPEDELAEERESLSR